MSKQLCLIVLLLTGLLWTSRAYAQGGTTGAISGIVTDSQGAAIPGVQVIAAHVTTGVTTRTMTNGAGVYTFPYLQLGQYEVKFNAKGMSEAVVTDVRVDEGNISRVDSKLEVGATSEIVNVTASAPLIEQESPTVDASVDRKLLEDLPSVAGGGTRAASDALAILPGVQVPGASSGNSYGSQFGVNVGGGRQFGTEFQMDGMSVAYQAISADVPLDMRPDYDLTAEEKVQEGVPTAEFGRTQGGVVTFLSRSGSNDFHGDAGVFIKNTIFDAHPYNSTTVTTDQNWEMDLSAGGPIWIPWLYNGRNKSFFFFNSTTYRQKSASIPATVTVPTAQERTGDFSDQPNVIYDPLTGQPFQGNVIPQARFSQVASQINTFYPKPTSGGLSNNLAGVTPQSVLQNDQFVRVDQQIGSRNHLMASYRHRNEPTLYAEGGPFGPELSGDLSPRSLHQDMVQDDWTISPHIVNHFAVGDVGFYTAQTNNPLGTQKYWVQVPGSFGNGFPGFCFETQGYFGLGSGLGNCISGVLNYELDRTLDAQDTVFWNNGAHSIKVGARYMLFASGTGQTSGHNGYYSFSGGQTAQVVGGVPQTATTGNAYASFLLGLVDKANMQMTDTPEIHEATLGIYAEDQWRATKNLSLSFGLRWDIEPPVYESQNRLAAMSPTTPNPGAGNLPGAYTFAPQLHVRNFSPTYYGAWAPRFGAAYSVRPDLVVRASFGVLQAPPVDGAFTDSTGFSGSKTVQSADGATAGMTWGQGWTNVVKPPSFDPAQQNGGSANIAAPNADHWATTNMWSLDIQKSLARNFAFTVGYVGNNTHHMAGSNNANQVNPGYLPLGSLLNTSISDPAVVAAGYNSPFPGFKALYGSGATLAQALKPYPQYQSVSVVGNRVFGANYNALLVKAEHHFSRGFQYLVSYTISKTLTNTNLTEEFGYAGPQNAYDLRAEKYLAGFDIPQALVLSYTYALPWGPGEPWLNHGFFSNILGGWATSGILTYYSGIPVVISAPNTLPLGNNRQSAEYLGGPITLAHSGKIVIGGTTGATSATHVLNPAAFGEPAPYTFGNAYILPSTRQAGYKSENASFFKRETFKERYVFELRFDMINLTNRKDPTSLDGNITDPATANGGFGSYRGSAIGPRTCQFDTKITF